MTQTAEGALLVAAKRLGLNPTVYRQKANSGLKYCYRCREWKPRDGGFTTDRSRTDGKNPLCRDCASRSSRRSYKKRPPNLTTGRRLVAARDGDCQQARSRIVTLVKSGIMPHPNRRPCSKCGHVWEPSQKHHEYHHHKGYAAEHHENVEALCFTCHGKEPKSTSRK